VFELISAVVRYFVGGIKSDATSAIGFVIFSRATPHRLSVSLVLRQADAISILNGATNYRMTIRGYRVVIEYRKRILIILMSIHLR